MGGRGGVGRVWSKAEETESCLRGASWDNCGARVDGAGEGPDSEVGAGPERVVWTRTVRGGV